MTTGVRVTQVQRARVGVFPAADLVSSGQTAQEGPRQQLRVDVCLAHEAVFVEGARLLLAEGHPVPADGVEDLDVPELAQQPLVLVAEQRLLEAHVEQLGVDSPATVDCEPDRVPVRRELLQEQMLAQRKVVVVEDARRHPAPAERARAQQPRRARRRRLDRQVESERNALHVREQRVEMDLRHRQTPAVGVEVVGQNLCG